VEWEVWNGKWPMVSGPGKLECYVKCLWLRGRELSYTNLKYHVQITLQIELHFGEICIWHDKLPSESNGQLQIYTI
jgi:hypothetical protein